MNWNQNNCYLFRITLEEAQRFLILQFCQAITRFPLLLLLPHHSHFFCYLLQPPYSPLKLANPWVLIRCSPSRQCSTVLIHCLFLFIFSRYFPSSSLLVLRNIFYLLSMGSSQLLGFLVLFQELYFQFFLNSFCLLFKVILFRGSQILQSASL